jgi:predicted nucleic acid-binding protein
VNDYVVIDTSIAFKWFVAWGEDSLDEAASYLRDHRSGARTIAAPSIMPVEMANVLRYAVPAAHDAVELLGALEDVHLHLFDATLERLTRATLRAAETGLTVYDALFLSLAEELECPLVSADRAALSRIEASVPTVLL